jgi:hypothetical protein
MDDTFWLSLQVFHGKNYNYLIILDYICLEAVWFRKPRLAYLTLDFQNCLHFPINFFSAPLKLLSHQN